MSLHLVGVDLSLTATGLAKIRPETGEPITVHTIGSAKVPNAGYPETLLRIRTLSARITKWANEGAEPGDLIVYGLEGPIFGQATGQYHTRAWLWGRVYERLASTGSVVVFEPKKIKSYAARKGNASKAEVVAAVTRNFPGVWITDDNQADALAMASMLARELGFPLEPSVQRVNPGALAGVDWPEWITQRRER